jgi:hypothetical protein
MILGFKYYTHSLDNKSSSSSWVSRAGHFCTGHSEDKLRVLNFNEHPHAEQQGCVPGAKQSTPVRSKLGQAKQMVLRSRAICSIVSVVNK